MILRGQFSTGWMPQMAQSVGKNISNFFRDDSKQISIEYRCDRKYVR